MSTLGITKADTPLERKFTPEIPVRKVRSWAYRAAASVTLSDEVSLSLYVLALKIFNRLPVLK